jgi:hypothetical protein
MQKTFFLTLVMLLLAVFFINIVYSPLFYSQEIKNHEEEIKWFESMNRNLEKYRKTPLLKPEEMKVSITVPKKDFIPGELVVIQICLQNTSSSIRAYEEGMYRKFFIKSCKKGNEIQQPDTPFYDRRWGSSRRVFAESNKNIMELKKIVNHENDLTLDGEYLVQVFHPELLTLDKPKTEWVPSNIIEISINSNLIDLSKVISSNTPKKWIKLRSNIGISIVTERSSYEEYGPIYVQVTTKNLSNNDNLLMPIDVTNVFNAYSLILKTPGLNRDFRKPRSSGGAKEAKLTLYGQKLFSEKSKEPKPIVTIKPGEEVAETVIVLNRIFDMSEDGIYGLIVSRKFIDENVKVHTVTSDPLPIRVGTALTQDEIDQRIKERQENKKNITGLLQIL